MKLKRVLLFASTAALAGCGVRQPDANSASADPQGEVARSAAAPVTNSTRSDTAEPAVPGDQLPFELFMGVPLDPGEARDWDNSMVEAGIAECMSAKGFSYIPRGSEIVFPAEASTVSDPNEAIVATLSPAEKSRYFTALDGEDPLTNPSGCTKEALDRAHPFNHYLDEVTALENRVYLDPRVEAATKAKQDCLDRAGWSVDKRDLEIEASCDRLTGWTPTARAVQSELETAFIAAHRTELEALRANRPEVNQ